jgi:hypothetical protein
MSPVRTSVGKGTIRTIKISSTSGDDTGADEFILNRSMR